MEKSTTVPHTIQNLSQANKLTVLFGVVVTFVLGFMSGSLMSTPLHCTSVGVTNSCPSLKTSSSISLLSNNNNNEAEKETPEEPKIIKNSDNNNQLVEQGEEASTGV